MNNQTEPMEVVDEEVTTPMTREMIVTRIPNLDALVISNVLTPQECMECTKTSYESGFKRSGENGIYFKGTRTRATFFAKELSTTIYQRIRPYLSSSWIHKEEEKYHNFISTKDLPIIPNGRYIPVGLNAMFRVSNYQPGGQFRIHRDTGYVRDRNHVGFWTILIYLNDEYTGGRTKIYYDTDNGPRLAYTVQPEVGKVFAFYHYHSHNGVRVQSGNKLIARTEIMYAYEPEVPPECTKF
jgi:prolyl 4-hydroxylase